MMNLVAVFVENKPGQTANVTRILAAAGVNICWLTIANSESFGVMKFLVDKHDQAMAALRASGLMVSALAVLAIEVPNRPGALQEVANLLAGNNLNLANCSGYVVHNHAVLIVELQDLDAASSVLTKAGFRLLTQDQMLSL